MSRPDSVWTPKTTEPGFTANNNPLIYEDSQPNKFLLSKSSLWGIAISDMWLMRLYIAGETESSKHAVRNIRDICDQYLKDRCEIEVVDLKKHPGLIWQWLNI
jgi:hypothetical protein